MISFFGLFYFYPTDLKGTLPGKLCFSSDMENLGKTMLLVGPLNEPIEAGVKGWMFTMGSSMGPLRVPGESSG